MLWQSIKCILVGVVLLTAFLSLSVVAQTPSNTVYQGVQIDAPLEGRIRIENQFGEVKIEVWEEKYVSISAIIDPSASFARSPVVIENRPALLSVNIVRRRNDPVTAIDLAVRVPQNAHVEVVTGKHASSMHGLPSSASLTSLSGDIRLELPASVNADIIAKSTSGSIHSTLPQLMSSNGRALQSRVGTGANTLRINTQSGTVTLSAAPVLSKRASERSDDPLSLTPPTRAAGIPAPLSDNQEISEGDVVRVDSQLVTLNMSVIDRNTNRGLLGLGRSDFKLFENGAEQEILQFESAAAPFDLLLVVDLSGSTREKVALIRSAALRFINAARPFDRIGVITFAGKPTVISSLTLDRQTLRERVNVMETAVAGDTKLYDATDFAATLLTQETQTRRRTAIVLMSDGLDGSIEGVQGDGSRLPYEELLSRVQEFDGVLYTLWLNTRYVALHERDTQPEAFDDAHDQMQEMASIGGGLFYEVKRLQDLAGAYERVVADLGTVYSLAYRPSDKARDGKWRAIKVNVNRPAAVARGKRGYYAN